MNGVIIAERGAAPVWRVGNGEPQVVAHGLALDHFVGVVVPVRERVGAVGAFVFDLGNVGKGGHGKFRGRVEFALGMAYGFARTASIGATTLRNGLGEAK